ncbi:JAB1/Mov34/MPN/PAD-1 ubiquitin protease-domain-containing protein [Pelagophyceae sp. CCMP2097]|nr:JAB1/Mov34/MPN/PAD-1 ubiquitin protease-domain-containing protein [Pelagophyceae sp. CCMP2097]
MSLASVSVSPEVLLCCVGHALSTEKEEVAGLLLGEWDRDKRGIAIRCTVHEALPLSRSDRRADRVEVEPAQLAMASEEAEARGLHVVGWYHSHPHITALPSHVDARTQGGLQYLETGFFGLIVAVFQGLDDRNSELTDHTAPTVKVAAFQSIDANDAVGGFASGASVKTPPSYAAALGSAAPPSEPAFPPPPRREPLWRAKDVCITVSAGDAPRAASGLRRSPLVASVEALARLQDALFEEELDARSLVQSDGCAHRQAHADAVLAKALRLVSVHSLYPLVHVAGALVANARGRKEAALARREVLLAEEALLDREALLEAPLIT